MKLNRNHLWPENLYHHDRIPKSLLVLHHTAGHGGKAALDYLRKTASKTMREKGYAVGTAYVIEREGTIFQAFDDRDWAYHSASGKANDMRSIGIELDNIGFLTKRGDQFYDLYGYNNSKLVGNNKVTVYDNGSKWRGYQYFEEYYDEQVDSLIELCEDIFKRHPTIPRKIPKDFFPEKQWPWWKHHNFKGVLAHIHFLGPQSKWDTSIAFKKHFDKFVESLNLEVV